MFKGSNIIDFVKYFESNENCLEYLSSLKW